MYRHKCCNYVRQHRKDINKCLIVANKSHKKINNMSIGKRPNFVINGKKNSNNTFAP